MKAALRTSSDVPWYNRWQGVAGTGALGGLGISRDVYTYAKDGAKQAMNWTASGAKQAMNWTVSGAKEAVNGASGWVSGIIGRAI